MRAALLGAAALAASFAAAQASELVDAVRADDDAAAIALIESGADVNAMTPDGATALHWAAYQDDVEMARRLIRAGADASVANDYGSTPLSEAAVAADAEMIALLLDAGADPNETNADGQTALMLVARTDRTEAARALIRAGADVNAAEQWRGQTALMWAAHDQRPAMTELLLEAGADPNARSFVNDWKRQTTIESRAQYRPSGGLTPLLYAAREGCLDCARALVEYGADVDLPDPDEIAPLLMAIDNLHFDVAQFLLEAGADPQKWDRRGRTPLYVAVDVNTLPNGGRPDLPSMDETTAMDIARALLAMGVEIDPQLKLRAPYRNVGADRGGDITLTIGVTPLYRAAKAFDLEATALLLEHGADPNMPQVGGITPTMVAAGQGSFDSDTRGAYDTADVQKRSIATLELLIAAGGDVNRTMYDNRRHVVIEPSLQPRQGQTAAHGAAIWGWGEVIRYLAENGADLTITDTAGKTVLDAALGRAGGNGRGGTSITPHPETGALIETLLAQDTASAEDPTRTASAQ